MASVNAPVPTMPDRRLTGRVLSVNVSAGGVPKKRVPSARVGVLGLDGDRHRDSNVHGGPHRAVCLFGIEAIRRVSAEGHPIRPGSTGENLTTEGVELSELPVGSRLQIGDDVLLELSWPTSPCDTIVDSFHDRHSGRISILRYPRDSRMYARVLREGEVRSGDPITVLAPAPGSDAEAHVLLNRIESIERFGDLTRWRAARAAGFEIEVLDDGDVHEAASRQLPGPAFNNAGGLRTLPHFLDRVLGLWRREAVSGWFSFDGTPWPGATPVAEHVVHAASIEELEPNPTPAVEGLTLRVVERADTAEWTTAFCRAWAIDGVRAAAWTAMLRGMVAAPGHKVVVGELDGQVVGVGAMTARGRTARLGQAAVVPEARGRGIHTALLGARIELAREGGVGLVTATADAANGASLGNLARVGLRPIWRRSIYRFEGPGGGPPPSTMRE